MNSLNAGAQDLTSNFLQLSGKDAVDGQAAAQRGIDQLKDQVLASASTPAAADRAQQAVNHWADGAKSIIDRHATAQQRVYDDDLDNTQVALGGNSVGLLYNDDRHYLNQLHVASQARADQVLRAATIASAQQATASDYTRTRIESALGQGDLTTATALTDRWGNDLLPADQDAVSQHLTYASFNQQSQQAGSQAMSINQPAPLGRSRNADMVLHRSGGGDSAGDQVADAGSDGEQGSRSSLPPGALSPLSAEPGRSQPDTDPETGLVNPSLFGFWRLPKSEDQEEAGYYNYNPSGRAYDPQRQYAAPETLSVINDLELKWGMEDNRRIGIGDINMPLGDDFPKTDDSPGPVHEGHHNGLKFDFRVLRKDGQEAPVNYTSDNYDRDATLKIIKFLKDTGKVKMIYFNDPVAIKQFKGFVHELKGHNDHIHVEVLKEGN